MKRKTTVFLSVFAVLILAAALFFPIRAMLEGTDSPPASDNNRQQSAENEKTPQKKTRDEMLADIEANYKTVEEASGFTRYSKTINGIHTVDFYNVMFDGEIVKSPYFFSDELCAEIKEYLDQNPQILEKNPEDIPEVLEGGSELQSITEEAIMIYMIDGSWQPIKTVFADYKLPDQGHAEPHTFCVNLLDGSPVDYADICVVE